MPSVWKPLIFGRPKPQAIHCIRTFGTADLHCGLHTHIVRMAAFLQAMCMTPILKFLSKTVIYS